MKKPLAFALLLSGLFSSAFALDVPPGWVGTYNQMNGYEVWKKEGGMASRAGEAAWTKSVNGAMEATTPVSPKLKDGRNVGLILKRAASGASLYSAARVLSGGGLGVLLVAVPAFIEWINGDGGVNIRLKPDQSGLEKKIPTETANYIYTPAAPIDLSWAIAPCSSTYGSACGQFNDPPGYPCANNVAMCVTVRRIAGGGPGTYVYTGSSSAGTKTCPNGFSPSNPVSAVCVSDPGWMPASMDDIAPYMTPRSPPVGFPDQILAAGGQIAVTPVSLTGPEVPLAEPAPYVHTTTYPKPADQTTRVETLGNPWGLPANTPTVTRDATTSKLLNPGSTSSTGPKPAGFNPTVQAPVATPVREVSTSTFDGTKTVTNTVTSQDAAQVVKTTSITTNITNTSTTSTVITNITNVTNITNTTKNEPLAPPIVDTDTKPQPEPTVKECEENPDRIGCMNVGDIPQAEKLTKTDKAVTVTAVAFSSSSACPAPLSFSVRGASYGISYGPICDQLYLLKFLFLAMAAFIASYILADSFRV